jgi:hypothetical protein
MAADGQTKGVDGKDFVQLVGVTGSHYGIAERDRNHQSMAQLLEVAKRVCGKPDMLTRIAEDFSGILTLAGIDSSGDKLTVTVNHPATGNEELEVTNTAANLREVRKVWRRKLDVNVFNPDKCPQKHM